MKLHELADLANTIEEKLIDSNGEITEGIELMLSIQKEHLPDTCERYAFTIDKMKANAQLYNRRANDLLKIAQGMEKMSDYLLSKVDKYMQDNNLLIAEGHSQVFKRVGCAKSLVISDPSQIPESYLTIIPQTTKPNNAEIKKALVNGDMVPGARLHGGSYLKIGVKK